MKTNKTRNVAVGKVKKSVDGDQIFNVIVEKAPPGLRRWYSMPNRVLRYGGLRNGYAKLHEFAVYARCSPGDVSSTHIPDQLAYIQRDAWSTGPTFPTLPSPIASEPGAVPPDNGFGLHDDEDAVPVSPDSGREKESRFCAEGDVQDSMMIAQRRIGRWP